jgi:hypothetical protein
VITASALPGLPMILTVPREKVCRCDLRRTRSPACYS